MKLFSTKRALSPLLFAAAVASLLNCGGGREESFTAQGDDAVMSGVAGIWMGSTPDGKTYTVTLCEDLAADKSTGTHGCETLHVVRGDGRGTTETTEEPTGCGGCNYTYSAFVSGSIEGDDLAATTVHGEFDLSKGDANGLGFPYSVSLISNAMHASDYNSSQPAVGLNGTMKQAGLMELNGLEYPPSDVAGDAGADAETTPPSDVDGSAQTYNATEVTTPAFELHRIGEASCPTK